MSENGEPFIAGKNDPILPGALPPTLSDLRDELLKEHTAAVHAAQERFHAACDRRHDELVRELIADEGWPDSIAEQMAEIQFGPARVQLYRQMEEEIDRLSVQLQQKIDQLYAWWANRNSEQRPQD